MQFFAIHMAKNAIRSAFYSKKWHTYGVFRVPNAKNAIRIAFFCFRRAPGGLGTSPGSLGWPGVRPRRAQGRPGAAKTGSKMALKSSLGSQGLLPSSNIGQF